MCATECCLGPNILDERLRGNTLYLYSPLLHKSKVNVNPHVTCNYEQRKEVKEGSSVRIT
jgi:hypothetical protein